MDTIIRKIPDDIWQQFRLLCLERKTSANKEVIRLVRREVEKAAKKKK